MTIKISKTTAAILGESASHNFRNDKRTVASDDQFDAFKSFGSPLEAIEYACSFGGSYADKVARAMEIVNCNVETSEFGFASEVVREIETIK